MVCPLTTAVIVLNEFSRVPVQGVWKCSRITTRSYCVIPYDQVIFRIIPFVRITCRNAESLLAPDEHGMRFFQTREREASFRLNPWIEKPSAFLLVRRTQMTWLVTYASWCLYSKICVSSIIYDRVGVRGGNQRNEVQPGYEQNLSYAEWAPLLRF
jgi:hypothetical protein